MKRDYYETPKASRLMRLFWKIAGGDRYILERSTYSDQIKYFTLGGIILSTGIMAAFAGGYAFYTIFGPQPIKNVNGVDIYEAGAIAKATISAIFFGLIWGAIIFNIDRFIVTSTGKGDGTEKITWDEFKGAIPRIIMGAIIALTISKPVEIRMFEKEIDIELERDKDKKKIELMAENDSLINIRINEQKELISKWETEINDKWDHYVELENEFNEEMSGGRGERGYGPEAKQLEEQMVMLKQDIDRLKDNPALQKAYAKIEELEQKRADYELEAEVIAEGLDGLLERIKLAHKIAGWEISLFITLLFLVLELTPIFFKLMLVRSPYDYILDNKHDLIKAENSILIIPEYYKDKEGKERDLVRNLDAEQKIAEKEGLVEVQKELTKYALDKYKETMKAKIDKEPEKYIKHEEYPKDKKA